MSIPATTEVADFLFLSFKSLEMDGYESTSDATLYRNLTDSGLGSTLNNVYHHLNHLQMFGLTNASVTLWIF